MAPNICMLVHITTLVFSLERNVRMCWNTYAEILWHGIFLISKVVYQWC